MTVGRSIMMILTLIITMFIKISTIFGQGQFNISSAMRERRRRDGSITVAPGMLYVQIFIKEIA